VVPEPDLPSDSEEEEQEEEEEKIPAIDVEV